MRIGYARVSTKDQKLDMQLDALKAAGCERIFTDHGVSGAKAERPCLSAALEAVQAGDVFMVHKLDRLGRSVWHLTDLLTDFEHRRIEFRSITEGIDTTTPGGRLVYHTIAAVAEFLRDLAVERTREGMAAAKRRGKHIGRPSKLTPEQLGDAAALLENEDSSLREVAALFDVDKSTLQKAIKREKER